MGITRLMIIRLTEKQLREVTGITDGPFDGGDAHPFSGQSEISVSGNPGVYKDITIEPRISGDVEDEICRPGIYNLYRGPMPSSLVKEGEEDKNKDGVDDAFNSYNMPVNIPNMVKKRMRQLVGAMIDAELRGAQCGAVLKAIEDSVNFKNIPYGQRRALRAGMNPNPRESNDTN